MRIAILSVAALLITTWHAIIQSAEPGERRGWCYPDEVYIKGLPMP